MNSLERRSSFDTAGLKKTKAKSIKEETVDLLFTDTVDDAVTSVRNWIEDCTGNQKKWSSFIEFIEDGVVLCELIQTIKPGLVKKINHVKSRFAYWENFSFFLESCRKLGLQDWQLFDPEEVLNKHNKQTSKLPSPTRESQERKLRNIVATIYWLAQTVQQIPEYSGPQLDASCFNTKPHQFGGSTSSLSFVDSSPSSTPEHKSLSVCSPDTNHKSSPLSSPGPGTQSPLLWVQKVHPSSKDHNSQEGYQFTQPDPQFEDSPASQTSIAVGDRENNSPYPTGESSKKRRETLSVLVEAHNAPPAYSVDLVFVHSNTNSSAFSPATDNHLTHLTIAPGAQYSPHHLSNTFCATDPIDSTGLLIDPLEFHSQVFTAGSGSQDSGPHFSQRSEATFHVNLTQTSQPDNFSTTLLEEDSEYPSNPELPSISELANNSTPIDTFDLHHTSRQTTSSNLTLTERPQIEFSYSQEYRDQYTPRIESPSQFDSENSYSNHRKQPILNDNSLSSLKSNDLANSSSSSSNTSVIVVSYTPPSVTTNNLRESHPELTQERRLPYRRYSSPQQRPTYLKSSRVSAVSSVHLDNTPLPAEVVTIEDNDYNSDSESEMDLNKSHRASGKRQMRVLPTNVPHDAPNKENNIVVTSPHTMNVQLILLPGEKQLGFGLVAGDHEIVPPRVKSVTGDSPASRAGLKPGDVLLSLDHTPLSDKTYQSIINILQQAGTTQRKLQLTIQRDPTSYQNEPPSDTSYLNIQNGYSPQQHIKDHMSVNRLSNLDMQRVHSGALPEQMTANKVVYTHGEENNSGPITQDELLLSSAEILSDINSTAVEVGSSLDTDSHHTISSAGGNDIGSRSELNRSSSLPSVDELLEPSNERRERTQQQSGNDSLAESIFASMKFNSPPQSSSVYSPTSPLQPLASDEDLTLNSGKSQSVTDLPLANSSNGADVYTRAYISYSNLHKKAKKTESLPGKFRGSLDSHDNDSQFRSKSSVPSVGLNLQNMSLEDVHSASKLQMDQIWQEVESSSSLTSPQVVSPTNEESPHPKDSILTQTPDEWIENNDTGIGNTDMGGVKSEPSFNAIRNHTQLNREDNNSSPSSTALVQRSSSKSSTTKGIDALLNTLRCLNEKVGTYDEEEEFKLLEELLQSSQFRKAKEFHDKMRDLVIRGTDAPHPHIRRVLPVTRILRHHLHEESNDIESRESKELRRLLRKPNVQATLFCHDKIATQDLYVPSTYFPKSAQDKEDIILSHSAQNLHDPTLFVSREAPLSREKPSSRKENAAIVYLERSNRPLGCTIYKQGDAVYVGKLLKGCDAEQSRVLREGDELLEINGIALHGKSTDEIIRLMSGEAGKILAFTLIPVHDDSVDIDYEEKYVRAHFGYNGQLDEEIPCKELALNFTKGEILEVSNQDDPDWWQARKIFDDGGESLPGLIPARHLQQKREVLRESYVVSVAMEEKNRRKGLLSKFSRRKKKKIYYNQGPMSGVFQSVGHEVATYEDVVKLMPDSTRKRPIVLIGAPCVGRRTLMKKLMDSNPRHYSSCIPHTTRPMRSGEMNGNEFHFVSREEMERNIQANKFLEYGESKGHLYGLSIKAVKRVIENNKIPVLDLHPQALKVIGSSGLMPYIIYIASPRLDRLQMTRRVTSEKLKKKLHTSVSAEGLNKEVRPFTESELLQLYHASQEIQAEYGHYFDWMIVNDDLQVASDMLIEVARRIEEEPQWIPASWVEEV